mmetsp:Transcript_112122/g.312082  ORF Transcript_112122/g.312082 Transcript_112122/m.312082 type:complete len:201 (+) Transcript_112122:104-706(+)|eukprot:CAMPEP_0179059672 /NCGR_PEP_ID=MMETSP0796-20121207/25475_1 /TAXON_ID=73915 /ORGANISM="Pyrodinium bahamense, Strain pbaha01" /LENGTH=200 /DNA_ID=CAMNT_0020756439 /DNA_START=61 /DNA_END=663 /DNA_ORIENTATION=+
MRAARDPLQYLRVASWTCHEVCMTNALPPHSFCRRNFLGDVCADDVRWHNLVTLTQAKQDRLLCCDLWVQRVLVPEKPPVEVELHSWLGSAPQKAQPFKDALWCTVQEAVRHVRHLQHHHDWIDEHRTCYGSRGLLQEPSGGACAERVADDQTAAADPTALRLESVERSSCRFHHSSASRGSTLIERERDVLQLKEDSAP